MSSIQAFLFSGKSSAARQHDRGVVSTTSREKPWYATLVSELPGPADPSVAVLEVTTDSHLLLVVSYTSVELTKDSVISVQALLKSTGIIGEPSIILVSNALVVN